MTRTTEHPRPTVVPGDALVLAAAPAAVLRRLVRALVVVWVVLALGDIVSALLRYGAGRGNVYGLVEFLDLNEESALGTWVSGLLLASCAVVGLCCALLARAGRSPWQRHWEVLAAVFAVMSLDEVAAVHDRISTPLRDALGTSGPLRFAWVIPLCALGLLFLLYELRLLRHLGRTGRDLFLCGVVFVTGAAGFEMAQGVYRTDGGTGWTEAVFPFVEELLEFAGSMWALHVLVSYLLRSLPARTTLQLERDGAPEPGRP